LRPVNSHLEERRIWWAVGAYDVRAYAAAPKMKKEPLFGKSRSRRLERSQHIFSSSIAVATAALCQHVPKRSASTAIAHGVNLALAASLRIALSRPGETHGMESPTPIVTSLLRRYDRPSRARPSAFGSGGRCSFRNLLTSPSITTAPGSHDGRS
jgi:hypothetical protein